LILEQVGAAEALMDLNLEIEGNVVALDVTRLDPGLHVVGRGVGGQLRTEE